MSSEDGEPVLGTSLERDAEAASKYIAQVDASLKSNAPGETDVTALKAQMFRFKERFFRRHAAAIYDKVTAQGSRFLRVSELLMVAAGQYPALLPTREVIDAERALKEQSAKEGRELDQGLFIGQVLADERCGMHLIHAMLTPKSAAPDRRARNRGRSRFAGRCHPGLRAARRHRTASQIQGSSRLQLRD